MARRLLHTANPTFGTHTQVLVEEATGQILIAQHQEIGPALEEAKALAGVFDRHAVRRNPAKVRHVARLPTVVVSQLEKAGIWQDRKKLLAWLSDPDNRVFRTDDGTRLA
jgi:hypothetical protein